MKLTDKDLLADAVQGAINIMETNGIDMMSVSVPLAIIKGAPTVEAIPVAWLEERLRKEIDAAVLGTGTRAGKEIAYSVFNVLELWKADKRRREAKA